MARAWVRRSRLGRPEVVAVLLPVLVMLALGLWRLDRGGMWRDEAVTFQVARRSVPQIWQLLHTVDAVHGLYYLLMHAVLAPHPGEVALRLPSVCAAAATAGLVAALGVRLCRPRVGLWAGLLYAVTPMTGHFAQEGRSYALVAAGAAGATLLLVRAVRLGSGGWWVYGVTVAVTCLLHEMAALLLLGHAATLALARVPARVWRGWGGAAGAVMLLLLPLLLVSQRQSAQVAWLPRPDLESVDRLLEAFTGPAVAGPCLVLIVVAVHPPFAGRGLTLQTVALPLMVVPPAVLIGVSQFSPLYDDRYVLYALAGAPLLVAAGAERLAGAVSRLRAKRPKGGIPRPLLAPFARVPAVPLFRVPAVSLTRVPAVALIGVLAIALALVCQLPLLRQDRIPDRRPDNLAAVSAVAGRELRPGDPVLFVPALARRSALAYPKGFHGVWDVALRVPAPVSGTLYGKETGPGELRRRLERLDRVWVVTEPFALRPTWYPSSATERVKLAVVYEEFVARQEVVRKGVTLRLYVRRPPIRLVEWAAAD